MSLQISGLRVGYRRREVLHDLDLTAPRGAVLGLLGPNGSGKSTLIKTIARIIRPTAGELRWDDTDLTNLSRRDLARLVAYVPQSIDVSFSLTVREAVLLGRTPHFGARPRRADWDRVDEAIRQLGLTELADRHTAELSGGQAQRVLIARALAQEPQILLLDEPTSALDLRYQLQTLHLAQQIAVERGIAVVLSIHDLNHAARFCDQVAFLLDGALIRHGRPADIYSGRLIEQVYGVDVDLSTYQGFAEIHPRLTPVRPLLPHPRAEPVAVPA